MTTLSVFLNAMEQRKSLPEEERERLVSMWRGAERVSQSCLAAMPSIGLFSPARRVDAFITICRLLDERVQHGELDREQAQLSLAILRMRSRSYYKAEAMFVAYSSRLSQVKQVGLPRAARDLLLSMRYMKSREGKI